MLTQYCRQGRQNREARILDFRFLDFWILGMTKSTDWPRSLSTAVRGAGIGMPGFWILGLPKIQYVLVETTSVLGTCWSFELFVCFWRALRPRRQQILWEAQQFFRMYLWRQYWYAKLRKKFLQLKLPAILLILSSHTCKKKVREFRQNFQKTFYQLIFHNLRSLSSELLV